MNNRRSCRQDRGRAFGIGCGILPRKVLAVSLLLLMFLLLPLFPLQASLTCNRLPMLIERFLDHHYALRTMTAEIKT